MSPDDMATVISTVVLLLLLAGIVCLVAWLLRPGARRDYEQEAARIPFREDGARRHSAAPAPPREEDRP